MKEKIIKKVKKHLIDINLSFMDNTEDERWFTFNNRHEEELRDGSIKEVYTVSFYTPGIETSDNGYIEGQLITCIIDAKSKEILYYETHLGYIESDGTRN